jgi:hypothetical protein
MAKVNFENVSKEDDLKWKMTSNGRLPQISKGKYLNNYWSALSQRTWGITCRLQTGISSFFIFGLSLQMNSKRIIKIAPKYKNY